MKKLITLLILSAVQLYAGIGVGTSQPGVLPVELTSFTAMVSENSVLLKWTTATEVNNYGFEIEKAVQKADKTNIIWEKTGFVPGHGNSNSPNNYSFTDQNPADGKYLYRLKQTDTDGKYKYSAAIEAGTGWHRGFSLEQNYPNPFNPTTVISYSIPNSSNVTVKVYDVLGRLVATLVNMAQEAGSYTVSFDGSRLSAGIYYYKIQSGSYTASQKMLLIK
ncbi:MAG: T9SS type A sorting domain-containing protein [Ignavibacteria bacterium]